MKRNIIFGSIFATLIILIQAVMMPAVVADDGEDAKIVLTKEQRADLENSISNFKGINLYNTLLLIYNSNINDQNEFRVSAINEMLNVLADFLKNSDLDIVARGAMSINEIIRFFIEITIYYAALMPVMMCMYIFEDVGIVIDYYVTAMEDPDFAFAVTLSIFLPDFYDVLVKFGLLKDVTINSPELPELTKEYIKDIFHQYVGDSLKSLLGSLVVFIGQAYLYPKLGYLSRMGTDIVAMCVSAQELVKDTKVKLEHFREIFVDVPKAFIDFVDPCDGEIIIDFASLINEIREAKEHAELWYSESVCYGPEILIDLTGIVTSLGHLIYYYTKNEEKPWLRPICVTVKVHDIDNREDIVNISFKDPLQGDTAEITHRSYSGEEVIYYETNITSNPYGMHTFVIVAEKDGKVIEKTSRAFSDGGIKIEMKFKKSKSNTENSISILKERLLNLFERINNFINSIISLKQIRTI